MISLQKSLLQKTNKELLVLVGIDRRPDQLFDQKELSDGIIVELEHTNDKEIAKKIAKDHLEENPKYYQILKQVGL